MEKPLMQNRRMPPSCSIDISEKAGVRFLHFGSEWVQGAMRIARPWSLELAYTRDMMTGLLFNERHDWPTNALQIGLGAGSLGKFIYRHLPACRSTIVEINPQIEFIARQYFMLPDDTLRLNVKIDDGADFMMRSGKSFDYIMVDGFDANAQAGPLETVPFYQACRARLSERGILSINFLGKSKGFPANLERLREAFDNRVFVLPACKSGNMIAFATHAEQISLSLDTLQLRAENLKAATTLDLLPTIAHLREFGGLQNGTLEI